MARNYYKRPIILLNFTVLFGKKSFSARGWRGLQISAESLLRRNIMGNKSKTLVLALIAVVLFTGLLQAKERDRNVEVRGVFVRRVDRPVGEREYLAIVVKPFESPI